MNHSSRSNDQFIDLIKKVEDLTNLVKKLRSDIDVSTLDSKMVKSLELRIAALESEKKDQKMAEQKRIEEEKMKLGNRTESDKELDFYIEKILGDPEARRERLRKNMEEEKRRVTNVNALTSFWGKFFGNA